MLRPPIGVIASVVPTVSSARTVQTVETFDHAVRQTDILRSAFCYYLLPTQPRQAMKASLLLISLAILGSGCGGGTDASNRDIKDARLEANKGIVMRFNDAQNAWDYDTIASLLAPDIKRHCQATPESPVNSREDYLALIKSYETSTPDAHQTINHIMAEGDMVAVNLTYSGTQTGPMGDTPPTGKHFDLDVLAMFRIEDGLIAEAWVEWDNLAILRQLGLFPPPAS